MKREKSFLYRGGVIWNLIPILSIPHFYIRYHIIPLRVSVLYTGHQERNNKWKNKAKTVKEQRTKEIEFNLQRLNAEFMAKPSTTAFVSSLDEHLTRFVEL